MLEHHLLVGSIISSMCLHNCTQNNDLMFLSVIYLAYIIVLLYYCNGPSQ